MKTKEKTFDLFYENASKTSAFNDSYNKVFNDILNYVSRHQKDIVKANVLLSKVIDQMLEHQEKTNDVHMLIGKNTKDYINKVDKTIRYKDEIQMIQKNDYEKYTISGLWLTMCGYLVLLFVKEVLTQRYFIHFSIDLIVAAIAMVVSARGIMTHWKLINRHQLSKKPLIMDIVGYVVGLFITVMTLTSPFDISFLILVIAHLVSKKMFYNEF